VNLQSTYRKGEYYRAKVATDNSGSPVWLSLTNIGVLPNGTNADSVATNAGHLRIVKTPETFTYDLDGNLTVTVRRSRLTPRALGVAGWRGETKII
jgi:hypothetical protein